MAKLFCGLDSLPPQNSQQPKKLPKGTPPAWGFLGTTLNWNMFGPQTKSSPHLMITNLRRYNVSDIVFLMSPFCEIFNTCPVHPGATQKEGPPSMWRRSPTGVGIQFRECLQPLDYRYTLYINNLPGASILYTPNWAYPTSFSPGKETHWVRQRKNLWQMHPTL